MHFLCFPSQWQHPRKYVQRVLGHYKCISTSGVYFNLFEVFPNSVQKYFSKKFSPRSGGQEAWRRRREEGGGGEGPPRITASYFALRECVKLLNTCADYKWYIESKHFFVHFVCWDPSGTYIAVNENLYRSHHLPITPQSAHPACIIIENLTHDQGDRKIILTWQDTHIWLTRSSTQPSWGGTRTLRLPPTLIPSSMGCAASGKLPGSP